ncbi:MAG: FtsK/SpoIIIE domain-containing protein [Lacisediminihabitans sp.]
MSAPDDSAAIAGPAVSQLDAAPRLRLPRLPQASPPRSFPFIATIAPVIGSVALWAIMRSPYVLVFALLGPLVALASLGDAALQNRRSQARERKRFGVEVGQLREAIVRGHREERAALWEEHRNLRALAAASQRDSERWRGSLTLPLPVVAGSGRLRSALGFDVGDSGSTEEVLVDLRRELASLRRQVEFVEGAPIVLDARRGIGVCGPAVLSAACARGLVLQLANALSPADYGILVTGAVGTDWLALLPHEMATLTATSSAATSVEFHRRRTFGHRGEENERASSGPGSGDVSVLIACAPTVDALPRACRVVFHVDGVSSVRVLPQPSCTADAILMPELVSLEQARAFARSLSAAAEAAGLVNSTADIPESLEFGMLYPEVDLERNAGVLPDTLRGSLACTPASGSAGPITLDLVTDGPHAIVGGTTGSGKSELLVSWVLAMAAQFPPDVVTFLLVDFKGGASFTAVQNLPHCVGVITDLDDHTAHRALTSLKAELRYRERALADAGVRSIEQLPQRHTLPRLVIVVDEFAAMMQDFPELHELFADVAARGRSLGVHLILCTQRPAGVVRDAVLANCTLRVSLRVNNRSDSIAVIGTAAAAELPRYPLGRALLCVSGGEPQGAQVALARPEDSERVTRMWAKGANGGDGAGLKPRRPWCDPLPPLIRLEELDQSGDGLIFGLADIPREQRQAPASYRTEIHGSLLVVGAHRSGKTGLLTALVAADDKGVVETVPRDQEGAWDSIAGRLAAIRRGDTSKRIVLIDDIDALLGSYPEQYAHAFTELVTAILREGGRAGCYLVLTACRLGSSVQSLAVLCDSRLVLRLPDRQEHALAGGASAEFDPNIGPGGGHWLGNRVQVGVPTSPADLKISVTLPAPRWDRWPGWAVVAARPAELARVLTAARGNDLLGPPEGWELVELGARSAPFALSGGTFSEGVADELAVGMPSRGRVIIADAETWQSHWGLIGMLKTTMPILFVGCSTAEFSAVSSLRALPPPIAAGSDSIWMLTPDGVVSRVPPPWKASI